MINLLKITMSISEIFSKAADYAKAILSRFGDLIILLVVSIIPIINLIAIGYYGRIIKDSSDSQAPPRLNGFWALFVDGLKVLVAGLIWSIPVIIIFLLTFIPVFSMMRWEHMMTYMTQPTALLRFASFILLLLMFVIAFAVFILAGIGIVHMFKTGSFGKAFAVGELINIVGKIGLLRYLFWIIVAAILGTIVGVFNMIPVIGWIISDLLGIILLIFLARSIGLMYDMATMRPATQTQQPAGQPPTPTSSPPPPPSPP
ncbi:MAG: DUF4013 domain-containing protein [Candidatus Methanomethyliaceae archaeon]|nr:DUF4013 domain-containing protein [Candidatus Methanomethyliaceae archaeon]